MEHGLNQIHSGTLQCPFCGAGGEYMRYFAKKGELFDVLGVMNGDYEKVAAISCSFCKAVGPYSENASDAYLKWNRRVK